ncbi:MAG: hypothetical protein Q4G07_01990 [Oscillospiraceae bacterium]|nr:hypothetical protein [Oscillospiraceae bacterium]
MKKSLSIIMVLVLACVMAFSLVGCCGGNEPYANVLDSLKSALEGNGKALVSVFPPEYDEIMKMGGMSMDSLAEAFEQEYADANVSGVRYKVEESTALTADEVSSINEDRKMYEALGITAKDVTEGYNVTAVYTADGEDTPATFHLTVILIDGKWYIDPTSMSM